VNAVRVVLVILDAVVGVTAVGGGIALAAGLEDGRHPAGWPKGTPFSSYLIPGLIRALAPALLGSAVRHWIGYLDGTPSAAAASHAAHGVVNLCLAATLPAARRCGVWRALATARCASTPDLPAVAFTSDYSRPGFLRVGFLPITRFTLWVVAA
jgi:hypothetical protein